MNKFNTKGGRATTDAWSQPHMSKAARIKCVGRISIAELQARTPKRYKRGKKKVTQDQGVPDYVVKNAVLDKCRFKPRRTAHGYTIIKLG